MTYELCFVANCYCDKMKNEKYHDLFEVICIDVRPAVLGGVQKQEM